MGEDIGEVQSSHGELGDDHLAKGGEGAGRGQRSSDEMGSPEDSLAVRVECSPSGSSREVAPLHDTARNEHPAGLSALLKHEDADSLGVLLVNDVQTSRSFQVRVNDHDPLGVLLLAGLAQDVADGFTELHSTSSPLLCAPEE